MPNSPYKATHEEALANPHSVDQRPSLLPEWAQKLLVVLFVVMVAASGVWAVTEHWRRATTMLGVAMLWLAAARGVCDDRYVGLFSVRSRRFDVAFCTLVGAALTFLGVSVDALGS
ncbi:hypothetical membrane protein [Corynebacterium renale]|uniref:DUF3017 family protein n=1 Tax=Corynebacterium renale TaxID=1724 RepID=A0A2A9DLU2_9CORY|nr:DUF3017 domain-containing protein [Corynebacterium renale]PFG27145.1 Protein of unknown function (DUF3017) [Corynebacterium renale]SQG64124.1 hypothetical membrane protein [Corynebacterium renale]SQI24025.1 hypothetical membrane protein [Corynebacterium renale]STC94379.1 hypothetical membrane protein [Corynebacterium renale]